jgi:hypothetical protein
LEPVGFGADDQAGVEPGLTTDLATTDLATGGIYTPFDLGDGLGGLDFAGTLGGTALGYGGSGGTPSLVPLRAGPSSQAAAQPVPEPPPPAPVPDRPDPDEPTPDEPD